MYINRKGRKEKRERERETMYLVILHVLMIDFQVENHRPTSLLYLYLLYNCTCLRIKQLKGNLLL